MSEVHICDDCGEIFKMASLDAWDFEEITQREGEFTLCKGCVYKELYEYCRKKVVDMKELVENCNYL